MQGIITFTTVNDIQILLLEQRLRVQRKLVNHLLSLS